jgi:hypothetical protein
MERQAEEKLCLSRIPASFLHTNRQSPGCTGNHSDDRMNSCSSRFMSIVR